jgi:hypothetical protein
VLGSDTTGLDLATGEPVRLERLQAVVAERDVVAARGVALELASLLLTELHSLWHQVGHGVLFRVVF